AVVVSVELPRDPLERTGSFGHGHLGTIPRITVAGVLASLGLGTIRPHNRYQSMGRTSLCHCLHRRKRVDVIQREREVRVLEAVADIPLDARIPRAAVRASLAA